MAHATATVIVDRPIGEVFGFLADGMNEPAWRPGVTDVSHVTETGTAVGATFKQTMKGPGGRSIPGDYRSAEFIDAARPAHAPGGRWFVDETYVKVAGRWCYLYRAVDQHGQVIDVLVSARRNADAAGTFFTRALRHGAVPVEVTTDKAPVYPRMIGEMVPAAMHVTDRYANNPVEADHGRLKARLRPMRGVKRRRSLQVVAAGHAFVQNLRRGHYELGIDHRPNDRIRIAFDQLAASL